MSLLKIKRYGAATLLKAILSQLFSTEIMKFHYLKIKLNKTQLQKELQGFNLDVKELIYDDFLLGDKSVFFGDKLDLIKKRFEDPTYKAYGIVEDGILKYSAWISMEKLGLPMKSNILLKPGEGYLEDDFCHTAYRGRGIHSKMNTYRKAKLAELGKSDCIVVVLDGNLQALQTQLKTGAKDLGCFYAGKLLGIPFVNLNKKKYDSF